MSGVTSWTVAVDTSQTAGLISVDFGEGADLSALAGASKASPVTLSAADGNHYSIVDVTGHVVTTDGTVIHRGERVAGTVWTVVDSPVPAPVVVVPSPSPPPPPPPQEPPAVPPVSPHPVSQIDELRQLLVDALVHIKATAALAAALGGNAANPADALVGLIETALGLAPSNLPPSA